MTSLASRNVLFRLLVVTFMIKSTYTKYIHVDTVLN